MIVKKQLFQKIVAITLIAGLIFTPTPVVVNAITGDDIKQVDDDIRVIEKYFVVGEDGNVSYYRDKAIEDGISGERLDFADQVYAYGRIQSNETSEIEVIGKKKSISEATMKAIAFPIYGNWCGPYYGSGVPIDLLDKGCKNHDNCYEKKGRHKCSCDKAFLAYINKNYSKMSDSKQKAMAKVIKAWLQIKTKNTTKKGGNFSCKK